MEEEICNKKNKLKKTIENLRLCINTNCDKNDLKKWCQGVGVN